MLIDSHCHLDFYPIPEMIARESDEKNILVIAVTNLPSHFAISQPHVKQYKKIRLALGLHPLVSESHTQKEHKRFEELIEMTSYIGEIGLDYSKEGKASFQEQVKTFRFVLECLGNRQRFITLHSRDAESAILDLLQEYSCNSVVFHWYTGPLLTLDRIVEAGHFFSINPIMVTTANGRKIISRIPQAKILTETDGPYTRVNRKSANPSDVCLVLNYLSTLWNCSLDDVERQVYSNFLSCVDGIGK